MHTKTSVLAGTFQTDPDAVCDAHPLGVVGGTLEAQLEGNRGLIK